MQGTFVVSHQCKSQKFTYRNCLAKQYLKKVKRRPPCAHHAKHPAKVKVTASVKQNAKTCSDPITPVNTEHGIISATCFESNRKFPGKQG